MSKRDSGSGSGGDALERLWAYEDFRAAEEHPGFDVTGAFASLGFLRAALRRTVRVWGTVGAIGLLLGCGLFVLYPPEYTAATSVVLTNSPDEDPATAITTDQALAESHSVAVGVVNSLHLLESASAFSAAYTVKVVTNDVLQITVSAPSSAEAVQRAQAVANQFLKFRAGVLGSQEAMQTQTLNQTVDSQQKQLDTLTNKLDHAKNESQSSSGTGTSGAGTSGTGQGTNSPQVSKLQTQVNNATTDLQTLRQTVQGQIADTAVSTDAQINNSDVLDPAQALPHSRLKYVLYYMVTGLFGGLVLGIVFIIVRELVSDRLRRRDDVADALGVPVKLSTGPVTASRVAAPRTRTACKRNLGRVSDYLYQVLTTLNWRPSALAVVAVGNARPIATAMLSVAEACVADGRKVVVADLAPDAPLARLLGVTSPGTRQARLGGGDAIVFVPDPHDVVSVGPLRVGGQIPVPAAPDKDLDAASRTADVILTLTELDPAIGAEHLVTWSPDAVAVVTAGLSHAASVYAVGEMLRLSKVRLHSAVLTSVDRGDESLGLPQAPPASEPPPSATLNGNHAAVSR